jgi:hypothetical protein
MNKIQASEDQPRSLIYVDVLGFAATTIECKVRVRNFQHEETGFSGASTTEMQGRINRFNTVLDQCVWEESNYGGIQAMLFSDCAFIVFDNSVRAADIARNLMRQFIKRGVAVRMGIGKGTFYDIEYLTKTDAGNVPVSKSRFIGTAVINAHAAEQCGGKGMRIFLDSSVEEDLQHIQRRLLLPVPLKSVKWELDYLHEPRPMAEQAKVEADDRELFEKVARMKNPAWPENVQVQYTETLDAMNRMRITNSRKPVDLNTLRYGGPADTIWP